MEIKTITLAQQNSDLKTELNYMKMNIGARVQQFESAICQLQERFSEMALMVQTLQATSYNGVFVWKILEIQRLKQEARIGQVTSLFSTPEQAWLQDVPEATSEWRWELSVILPDNHEGRTRCLPAMALQTEGHTDAACN